MIMGQKKILIADDHSLMREGIVALLSREEDFRVVGEAATGDEAIRQTESLRPDIVLMDIAMPGLGGLEATVEIKKRFPDTKILVLSQYDDREYVGRFLRAGVSGYILKRAEGSELISAIRAVARGENYLYPAIASNVIEDYLGGVTGTDDSYDLLSDREKQVLKLIAEGNTHKECAVVLGISERTVIAHQSKISEKLDIHSKADIIKFAIAKGIIKL